MWLSKLAIYSSVILLSACATDDPLVKIETQQVEIPIPVACKADIPVVPTYNFPRLSVADTMFAKTKALIADRNLSKAYQTELLAALKSCK